MIGQLRALVAQYSPQRLSHRFALVSAVLTMLVLLVSSLGSWWLSRSQAEAVDRLLMQKEADYGANLVGTTISGVISRMDEMADGSLLISAVTDSVGREGYLHPYLSSINSINGIPVSILFTDHLGNAIASNRHGNFTAEDYRWMVEQINLGKDNAMVQSGKFGPELIAVEMISPPGTGHPEGALLYKFLLHDIVYADSMELTWRGKSGAQAGPDAISAAIDLPDDFDYLGFRIVVKPVRHLLSESQLQLVQILSLALLMSLLVFYLGRRLAHLLTRDLRQLELFSREVVLNGFDNKRAEIQGNDEVSSLATSVNNMLDALNDQHLRLLDESDRRAQILERYRLLVESTHAISWEMILPELYYSFVSPQAEELFAYALRDWHTAQFSATNLHPEDAGKLWDARNHAAQAGEQYRCEYRFRHRDGHYLWIEEIGSAVSDADGTLTGLRGIMVDITQRKQSEQEIERLAFYDALTGLPNRRLLTNSLQQLVDKPDRKNAHGAVVFIDLDNFKTLNDTYGHDIGDIFLVQAAARLKNAVRVSDMVARLGGDEFIIVMKAEGDSSATFRETAVRLAKNIVQSMDNPYLLEGNEHHSSASLGIYFFDAFTDSVTEMLQRADLAMYHAKENGRNGYSIFDPAMLLELTNRTNMEFRLRHALRNKEFQLYYQPQINADGKTLGFEALLRWNNPELGLVEPAQFIFLAEETGLIIPIGEWVIEQASRKLAEWEQVPAYAGLTLSVNVSIRQFAHKNFIDNTINTVSRLKANPHRLTLELTESLLMNEIDSSIEKIRQLKDYGFRFSLDDFGTGYSSLAYLRNLPIDELKIDRSFFANLLVDEKDAAIVKTIVVLAKSLGMELIAEGVESESQRAVLASYGCHVYQGYLYGVPMDEDALRAYLATAQTL